MGCSLIECNGGNGLSCWKFINFEGSVVRVIDPFGVKNDETGRVERNF